MYDGCYIKNFGSLKNFGLVQKSLWKSFAVGYKHEYC